ncbi:hypothetical protein V2J09_018574 [Rumex salicifolius]
MADLSKQFDVENIFSYCDDLVEVLGPKRDANNLTRCLDRSSAIQSSFTADFEDLQSSIRECQKKIDDCKQKTDEAKSNIIFKMCWIRSFLERKVEKQIDDLDQQRLLIEERRRNVKKLGLDGPKALSKLSFYASVTNIIPNLHSGSKISGQIIKRDKNVVEMFEIDPMNAGPYDACNKIWEMID